MRLAPRSLFSRLVLVLLGGLIVAQLVSFAIHMHERGEVLSQASGMQAAQRIADIVRLLEPLGPAERRRIVQAFSAPPLTISLEPRALDPQALDAEGSARAALFGAMLRRFLGDGRPVAVALSEGPGYFPPPAGRHPGFMGGGAAMHARFAQGPSFVAQVRLKDGALVTFDARQPAQTSGWPYRLLLSLGVLLAAVIAVSLVAVRWATRPLNALADAADELGRNIERPPLPEKGPLEVARAARAFNTMQARLARYLRERTAMLAAMSHDLKTPVTRLRLRAELLEDGELKKKISQDLAEMEALVQASLEFMKGLETGERPQPVDVMALLESLQADAVELGGKVELQGAASGPYAGRPQALKRCLGNLLDNALQYGQSATIVVDDDAERLSIRIRDRGPGIPQAELERVFEPFYRVEGSRSRNTGGTGLGLSIARTLAQLHGGTLTLRNLAQGGLEAALTLPRR
ncbi:MAG TPA: ATP-binding protein [Burkholderiales bacterium]